MKAIETPEGPIYLPDRDQHFQYLHDSCDRYQHALYDKVMGYMHKEARVQAVDIGAHVGLWARRMVRDFRQTICFEPIAENVECLRKNLEGKFYNEWKIFHLALSNWNGQIGLSNPASDNSGAWAISDNIDAPSVMSHVRMLDMFIPWLQPNLIKIDVQGHELEVLRGAVITLQAFRPVLIIETKVLGEVNTAIAEFLHGIGYTEGPTCKKDQVFVYMP